MRLRRQIFRAVAVLSVAIVGGKAFAQDGTALWYRNEPATKSQLNAVESLVLRLTAMSAAALNEANATDVFRQLIDVGVNSRGVMEMRGALRHYPSGLNCVFSANEAISVQIFHRDGVGSPDGLSCTVQKRNETFAYYAYRQDETNLETELGKAIDEIKTLFPNLREVETPMNRVSPNAPPYSSVAANTRNASVEYEDNSRRQFASVFVTQRGDWILQLRHKGPKSSARNASAAWYDFLASRASTSTNR